MDRKEAIALYREIAPMTAISESDRSTLDDSSIMHIALRKVYSILQTGICMRAVEFDGYDYTVTEKFFGNFKRQGLEHIIPHLDISIKVN